MRRLEIGLVLPMEESWTDGFGSSEEIADGLRRFRTGGFTHVEVLLWPRTLAALEAMAPALELLETD